MKYFSDIFFITTAEDQDNYFTGDFKFSYKPFINSHRQLFPGNYRIIDGELNEIIDGLSKDQILMRFDQIKNFK